MDRQIIARRLKKLRKGRPMAEVAAAVGISVSSLGMYETGARMPRDVHLSTKTGHKNFKNSHGNLNVRQTLSKC